ncbi:MAG: glycyl-radical enzyme activating protein [Clostridia bacterium]|nr:glycyl-radical enzyme activating protein [Clostridia bacterium]
MGIVFDISRCAYHDGPGIRTTVFLKGCSLRCIWCHNPESFSPRPEIELLPALCIGCRRCARLCPAGVHRFTDGTHTVLQNKCTLCGACVKVCPQNALKITGREMTADEVLAVVLRDRAYYAQSGGGVTFSGGEPTVQVAFLRECLEQCKAEGLHTALETNGCITPETLETLLPLVDLWLLDCKAPDAETLKAYTGGDFARWQTTLETLSAAQKPIWLRLPIIPGVNDTDAHFAFAGRVIAAHPNIERYEILPYHTIGVQKWAGVGRSYTLKELPAATKEQAQAWNARLAEAIRAAQA